jgi:hypothetical protein
VLATFGRGFYVLDDYSPLREMTPANLGADTYLLPLRHAYLFNTIGSAPAGSASIGDLAGNYTTPNPPSGAVFTYHVNVDPEAEETLVLIIRDDGGEKVRELELEAERGLQRVEWDLRGDPPEASASGGGGGPGGGFGQRARRGPPVEPGRYVASLGWKVGEDVVEVGPSRTFHVIGVDW